MFYTPVAQEARAFFRDKVGLPCRDVGDGWLIFDLHEGELGFHPGEEAKADISFYCEDIYSTVAELKSRGVEFSGEIEDHGFGLCTYFVAPGDLKVMLYQKKY